MRGGWYEWLFSFLLRPVSYLYFRGRCFDGLLRFDFRFVGQEEEKEMKGFLNFLLSLLWCLADPKKATEAANEAATIEEFDSAMMKEMGGRL